MTPSCASTTADVSTSPLPVPSTTSRICTATEVGSRPNLCTQDGSFALDLSEHAFGLPSVVICKPSLPAHTLQIHALAVTKMQLQDDDMHPPGSTPVSNMATITPRPSLSGCRCINAKSHQYTYAAQRLLELKPTCSTFKKSNAPISSLGIAAANSMSVVTSGILSLSSEDAANGPKLLHGR